MDLKSGIQSLSKITRAGDWRLSFIPFIIGCVYFWVLWFDIGFSTDSLILIFLSLLTSFGFAAFGYFVNEFFDKEVDRKAGKLNKMELLKPIHQSALFLGICILTFMPWYWLSSDKFSYILIGVEILLFFIYSFPFPRLKNNPYISGIIDASYAYVVPLMLSFHTYDLYDTSISIPLFIYFFLVAIFFIGFRNITIHHVNDIFKDIRSGVPTLPQKLGPKNTNHLLLLLFILEIVFFLFAIIIVSIKNHIFIIWVVFYVIFIVYRLIHFDVKRTEYLSIEPVRHLTDPAYQIIFPIFMLLFLCINDWRWVVIIPLHMLILLPRFSWDKFIEQLFRLYGATQRMIYIPIRTVAGNAVNYSIFYIFRLFGVNLKNENKSAVEYIKHRIKR